MKYLGVLITHSLNWAAHIHSGVSKTRQKLCFLYCKFYNHCNTAVLRKLYVSQIWSTVVMYGTPSQRAQLNIWKKTQKLAAKICLKKWNLSYTTMLRELNLPTLQSRRHIMKLCVVYAILTQCTSHQVFLYIAIPVSALEPILHCASSLYIALLIILLFLIPSFCGTVSHHASLDLHHCCLLNVHYMFGSSSLSLFCLVHSLYLLTILH